MNKIIDEVTNLTNEWYLLIGKDHHKDRDCHWYINTKWSYGQPPVYIVEHYGYVYDKVEIKCKTYNEALKALKEELEYAIKQEKNNDENFEL
jgi:hypothetical protein